MPQAHTVQPLLVTDHALEAPSLKLMKHVAHRIGEHQSSVYIGIEAVQDIAPNLEDFLYFLCCTTDLSAESLTKAIEQFTANTKP